MGQQGDYGQYGQGQPRRPQQQDPRLRPAATPPQWGQQAPPRQDGTRGQLYPQEPQAQPAFQPAYPSRPQPPRGQYPQPQPPRQPQYQPQPQYAPGAPPQSPQRPRKSRKGLAFLGCGGLGALVVLIAVLASSSSQSPSAPAAGTQQTQAAAPAPVPSTAAAVAPETVATYQGSGITNTPQFTVSSTWKLDYSFNCSSFGSSGNFIVLEDGSYGAMSVNELAESKTGSSYAYNDAGTHYLEIDSECSWTVTVVDEG